MLEPINWFIKVVGYKVIMQKLIVFSYSSKEQSEKKIKETMLFDNSIQRKKNRNKFNQGNERLVHWKLNNIAERKKQINGKASCVHELKDLVLLRCWSILFKTIYKFNAIPIQISIMFLQK